MDPDTPVPDDAEAGTPVPIEPGTDQAGSPVPDEAEAATPGPIDAGTDHGDAAAVPRWGRYVVLGLVAGLLLSSVLASVWLSISGDEELSIGGKAFSQLGLWAGLVGGPVLASRRRGSGSLATDFGWRFRWADVGLGAAAAVVAVVVVVPVVGLLLRPLLGAPDVSQPVKDLVDEARGPAVVGLILIAAVGAPLVEELFFRGLLLRTIQRSLGTAWAIAGSSVFFGLAHPNDLPASGQILVMSALAALAVLLATLVVRTGRLGPAIVAHAIFNAVNLAIAFTGS